MTISDDNEELRPGMQWGHDHSTGERWQMPINSQHSIPKLSDLPPERQKAYEFPYVVGDLVTPADGMDAAWIWSSPGAAGQASMIGLLPGEVTPVLALSGFPNYHVQIRLPSGHMGWTNGGYIKKVEG